jgi:hypothetical protein
MREFNSNPPKLPRPLKNSFNLFLLATFYFLALARPAFAYVDPGTGSLIFQLLISAFVGGLFVIKTYWQKIKNWFSGTENPEATNDATACDRTTEDETTVNAKDGGETTNEIINSKEAEQEKKIDEQP